MPTSALIIVLATHWSFSGQHADAAIAADAGCFNRTAIAIGVASAPSRDVACVEADSNETPFSIVAAPSSVDWQPAHALEPAGAPFDRPHAWRRMD
jgi:hypothetical protein